ncbi:MAG: hypothetical protein QM728_01215 [Gordonia sp. (in: high G+C Gram-positive bacteria)]|uniref:hypothetical protein n=1 Tax=Gordonia sp. (in: high G+C Gram-positive bacteria) TaxID=84139 RepID=UPI0039E6521D
MSAPDDDPDAIPSQAELDELDLEELASTSAESDLAYPIRDQPIGPPPPALARDTWAFWWISAAAGIASAVYLLVNVVSVSDSLQRRLMDDIKKAIDEAARTNQKPLTMPADEYHGLAHFLPPAMVVTILVLLAVQFLLLRAVTAHHSRNARNIFLAMVLLNLVCIPTGMDLLRFADNAPAMFAVGWVQFGALLLSALCILRPSVGQWLPVNPRVGMGKLMRPGG